MIQFTSFSLPSAKKGEQYEARVMVAGSSGTIRFSLSEGELPAPLEIDQEGWIHGIPSREGVYGFTVSVTDAGRTISRDFEIRVFLSLKASLPPTSYNRSDPVTGTMHVDAGRRIFIPGLMCVIGAGGVGLLGVAASIAGSGGQTIGAAASGVSGDMTIFRQPNSARAAGDLDITPSEASGPITVWRADAMSPRELERQGMFLPRGMNGSRPNQPPPDISLWNHINGSPTGMSTHRSGYVSTSASRMSAFHFLVRHMNGEGYLYEIKVTPNFIDAAGTLRGTYNKSSEQEYSALGGIRFDQVKGWVKVSFSTEKMFKRNNAYNASRYEIFSSGSVAPPLAGFPRGHWAWKLSPWAPFSP